MEVGLLATSSFLFGALLLLSICVYILFFSHQNQVDRALVECDQILHKLNSTLDDFKKVTAEASAANQSLGQAIIDFDTKLKDLESRIVMTRMHRER